MEKTCKKLLKAIEANNTNKVKEIVSSVEDVEEVCDTDVDGITPLYLAAKLGRDQILKLLLDAGADPHCCHSENGYSPAHIAVKKKQLSALHVLLETNNDLGNIEADSSSGRDFSTPVHLAAECEDPKFLALLLVYPGDRSKRDFSGRTALWRATHRGFTQNVQLLLKSGANPDVGDSRGITPLMVACTTGNYPIISELLKANVSLNFQDEMGDTALHHAAQIQEQRLIFKYNLTLEEPRQELFFRLILAGSDCSLKNKDGDTALDIIEMEIAEVFDLVFKFRTNLSDAKCHSFRQLRSLTDSKTLFQVLDISQEDAFEFVTALNHCNLFIQQRADPDAPPCTLIKTDGIPNKRKFKKELELEKEKPKKTPKESRRKRSTPERKCPLGFVGPNPHKEGHPGYDSNKSSPSPSPPIEKRNKNSGKYPPRRKDSPQNQRRSSDVPEIVLNEAPRCPFGFTGPNPHPEFHPGFTGSPPSHLGVPKHSGSHQEAENDDLPDLVPNKASSGRVLPAKLRRMSASGGGDLAGSGSQEEEVGAKQAFIPPQLYFTTSDEEKTSKCPFSPDFKPDPKEQDPGLVQCSQQ